MYDYVGAVYGAQGKVVFGKSGEQQVLTAKEKSYVASKFGLLEGRDIKTYLTRAREIFFKDLNFPVDPACRGTAEVWPVSLSHQDFGAAWVFHGFHGCGGDYGSQLTKSGVELSIAADPAPWRFFLEGYGTKIANKVSLEEMALFTRMAKTLNIPLQNPLPLAASSLEVRNEAANSSNNKYKADDFAVAMVFQVAAKGAKQNPRVSDREIFNDVIDKLAPEFGIPRDQLFEKTRSFLRAFPTMEGQVGEIDQRAKILADTANRMNEELLRKQVSSGKSPSRKNLFVIGSNHLPLVEAVYSPKK